VGTAEERKYLPLTQKLLGLCMKIRAKDNAEGSSSRTEKEQKEK
jgi:hypothetical protein